MSADTTAILRSIQVSQPRNYGFEGAEETHDKPWTTGFFKEPIGGEIFVGRTNLAGDGQADLKNHGGIDKAVLAYSADHYPGWRRDLGMPDLPFGGFGENLTIDGLSEESVFIGDKFSIGPVIFEISQPRQPCWKLARRWRRNDLVPMVLASGRTGWYLRVVEEGRIEAGMPVVQRERPNPAWPVARCNHIMHQCKQDLGKALELMAVPRLADAWVHDLRKRVDRLRGAEVLPR